MSDITRLPSPSAAVKIASVLVHLEELLSPEGHPLDEVALRSLVGDSEVQKWLGTFDEALLPRKRAADRKGHRR